MTERFDHYDGATLAAAILWLHERVEKKGAACPCCEQFTKVYRRPLNASMAYVLVLIYQWHLGHGQAGGWLHVPSHITEVVSSNARRAAAVRGDWAKLRYWGFIAEDPDRVGKGYYRITLNGIAWVLGKSSVPAYIHLYNGNPVSRPVKKLVTVRDVMGKRFSYDELMEATTHAATGA